MSLSYQLRAMFSRYRRQTPHVQPNRYRRGHDAGQAGFPNFNDKPGKFEEYDPVRSIGYPASPQYKPPDSSHDPGFCGTTPPERFWLPNETAGTQETPVDYDTMLLMDAMIGAIRQGWQEMHDRASAEPMHEVDSDSFQQALDSMAPSTAAPEQYDAAEMTQEFFDDQMAHPDDAIPAGMPDHAELDVMQAGLAVLDALADSHDAAMMDGPVEEMPLEDTVEQQFDVMMNQMDPMSAPEERDPFQAMQDVYDQQMQLLMDPFMMMGPMG